MAWQSVSRSDLRISRRRAAQDDFEKAMSLRVEGRRTACACWATSPSILSGNPSIIQCG